MKKKNVLDGVWFGGMLPGNSPLLLLFYYSCCDPQLFSGGGVSSFVKEVSRRYLMFT